MFAKLKKKIAEEAAIAPRPGGAARIPRSISKESVASVGADSGDDFASDGSSSREDLSSQLFRRNEQIRKLEAKLSEYAEQVRNLQKIKEKLEIALEKHQDSSMRKFQEQNETYQANRAKMAEGMALALAKKDQEWAEKLAQLEKDKRLLTAQLQEMKNQSLNLFQKRDEIDELEGFQQQELAKVKHMLLKKEESLAKMEQEMEARTRELSHTHEELLASVRVSSDLSCELEMLQRQYSALEEQRDHLLAAETDAESKITTLEQREQELRVFIQQLSVDLQKAQVTAACSEKRLGTLQAEHESLKLDSEQQNQKAAVKAEEREKLIEHLQEKVLSLEKRLEGNLSGEEHVQELLKEKTVAEQKLDDARQQLLAARTSQAETVSLLETQITQLNSQVTDSQALLHEKEEFIKGFRESSLSQVKELEEMLQVSDEKLKKSNEIVIEKEAQIQRLQSSLAEESNKLQQHILVLEQQYAEQGNRLEAEIAALEKARESDNTAANQQIQLLEEENANLKKNRNEYENSLEAHKLELKKLKEEWNQRETVSVEIAKALEETRKQREDLQQQVADLTTLINEKEQFLNEKTKTILQKEEEIDQLKKGHDLVLLQMHQLQSDMEAYRCKDAKREEDSEGKEMNVLRLQIEEEETLQGQGEPNQVIVYGETAKELSDDLYPLSNDECTLNGEVDCVDMVQLQKENRDLEQQIIEKNKTIKQLQQRMLELKKTLQKELKIRPENDIFEVREKPNPEVPTASTTVTNNSDLNDSREINFEYLKHVVLKFMSCRESEAFHLIKAVSVLLNFSQEEENMLKETLEYKMSWFGSKPSPRGSIRPSISNPRVPWS
ncbi:golgin subfamily A member 1 isoform X1 [Dromiciops gliroides]|uniref:golgin subfamily A member 1 isoform X1 n=1 Tax=Dromiciops gliroides TaxID=33562 RepID=UPI001CC7508A|nr:golgin subfamily A member 1 isoform X1 [Dromiciops gliroides]XP_043836484.1 golgin subfamily A member 1 isoform X1 [Dromiciops gliroides]